MFSALSGQLLLRKNSRTQGCHLHNLSSRWLSIFFWLKWCMATLSTQSCKAQRKWTTTQRSPNQLPSTPSYQPISSPHGLGKRVQRGEWGWKGSGGSNSLRLWMLSATAGGGRLAPSQKTGSEKQLLFFFFFVGGFGKKYFHGTIVFGGWWWMVVCVFVYIRYIFDGFGCLWQPWPLWVCEPHDRP